MKAKRRFNIWLWVLLCVPCLLASCDHDVHSDEEESGLSVSLTWADEADKGTEVKDVKLWIFNADDGSLVEEKHYGSTTKGTEMSGKALDAAWCLFPTQKNSDGEYGLPSIEPTEVEMPTILATESTLQSEVIRLMPTIQGSPASHVYLRLLLPDETLQEYDITAPAMKVGGKYELRLNYNQMQPKMNLEATINGWTNLNNEVEIK